MRHSWWVVIGLILIGGVVACADSKKPPQNQPQPQFPPTPQPPSGYTQPYAPADNDDTYVPMNYYY